MPFSEKFLRVPGVIEAGGRQLKRYHISTLDAEIEDGIQKAAYEFLPRLLSESDEQAPPAGWVVLHRGLGPAYLCAYSWVWDNVVEYRTAAAGIPLLGCEDEDPENFKLLERRWMGCVWELAPLEHERSSWVRHMLEPDQGDLAAYLADTLPEGLTGGPRYA